MRKPRPRTLFGVYLASLLESKDLSVRSFARRVGAAPSTVVNAMRLTLNLEEVDAWADALELEGSNRHRFKFLAHLAHADPWMQSEVLRMDRLIIKRGKGGSKR